VNAATVTHSPPVAHTGGTSARYTVVRYAAIAKPVKLSAREIEVSVPVRSNSRQLNSAPSSREIKLGLAAGIALSTPYTTRRSGTPRHSSQPKTDPATGIGARPI
jgi:hypothetical protein